MKVACPFFDSLVLGALLLCRVAFTYVMLRGIVLPEYFVTPQLMTILCLCVCTCACARVLVRVCTCAIVTALNSGP